MRDSEDEIADPQYNVQLNEQSFPLPLLFLREKEAVNNGTFLLGREGSSFAQPGLFPDSLKEDFPFSNYSHLHRKIIWRNLPAQGDLAEAFREQSRVL